MRIPPNSLLTLKRVERSSIGPLLFKTVDRVDDSKLFHEKNDLVLSLFLAFVSFDVNKDSVKEHHDVLLYLATLPENDSYDNLPRRWSDEKLNRLLGGTSALSRARAEKKGLGNDYDILLEAYTSLVATDRPESSLPDHRFPPLERFDQMLAAVGSRAFQSLGQDGIDAMIPLLDLLDHKRGVGETSDVSYTKEGDGSIHVIAKRDLNAGCLPGITYGAKGNAQLLTRYGFTLRHNIEPDGSSNDVMELKVKDVSCTLRTGPKAYTYGCFVKILELLKDKDENADTIEDDEADDGPGDMEDFLNSCEEEDEFDMYGDMDNEENADVDEDATQSDCQATESLKLVLKDAADGFNLKESMLEKALEESPAFSSDRFCAYLVASEMRTIHFYLQAADLIRNKLKGVATESDVSGETEATDSKLLQNQALELRDVYCRIRYPDFP